MGGMNADQVMCAIYMPRVSASRVYHIDVEQSFLQWAHQQGRTLHTEETLTNGQIACDLGPMPSRKVSIFYLAIFLPFKIERRAKRRECQRGLGCEDPQQLGLHRGVFHLRRCALAVWRRSTANHSSALGHLTHGHLIGAISKVTRTKREAIQSLPQTQNSTRTSHPRWPVDTREDVLGRAVMASASCCDLLFLVCAWQGEVKVLLHRLAGTIVLQQR